MRLIQFVGAAGERQVAALFEDGGGYRLIPGWGSVRELALDSHRHGVGLQTRVEALGLGDPIDYARVIAEKRLMPPLDHPDPGRCTLAITGLTHLGSAESRDAMHAKLASDDLSDSMKMFKSGIEGGKPAAGTIGVQPEWAYKGDGDWLVDPEKDIRSPDFAEDGGDEAEIAGLYVVADDGQILRVGFALANEFSDHVMERRNYLYLAHSKLRPSSFGPELLVGELPPHVEGETRLVRHGRTIWRKTFISGEANMSHSIENLEHHHFKYVQFRRAGDVHVYFFGASVLSFADGIRTEDGDLFEIECPLFGAPLRNRLTISDRQPVQLVRSL